MGRGRAIKNTSYMALKDEYEALLDKRAAHAYRSNSPEYRKLAARITNIRKHLPKDEVAQQYEGVSPWKEEEAFLQLIDKLTPPKPTGADCTEKSDFGFDQLE